MMSSHWNSFKYILNDKMSLGLKLLFCFVVIYLCHNDFVYRWLAFSAISVALMLIVLFVNNIRQSLLWTVFLVVFLIDLAANYFVRANHHFLLIYVTLLVIVYLKNQQLENFQVNLKLVIVIVLLFSAIQKLCSPTFINGDFYFYMLHTGNFFKPLHYLNPEIIDIIQLNKNHILELGQTDPNTFQTIQLKPISPGIEKFCQIFAWTTIAIEFITALLLFFKPTSIWSHLFFLTLIVGIFLTRMENGFLTLLAISGVWLSNNLKLRSFYAVLAIVFMALIISKIGFH